MAEMRQKQDRMEQLTTTLLAAATPNSQEFELPPLPFRDVEAFDAHEPQLMRNQSYNKFFVSNSSYISYFLT
jgi:hypothetical protein